MDPNYNLGQNNPSNPQGPMRRPMQQRPMNDFAPRPSAQLRPMHSPTPPQPAMQRPANTAQPYKQMRPGANPAYAQPAQQPQQPAQPMTFEPPKKKKKISLKKILSTSMVAAILLACSFVFIATGDKQSNKTTVKAQNGQPAVKPLEKTDFTPYYPNPLPPGLKARKSSITFYKDSFTFVLEQGGQKAFFVYEQPESTDPGLSTLKSKLAAPKDIALTIGSGIEGGLDNGTVTAVKTDKNTIIIVDCIKAVCSTTAHDILSNMQVNTDLDALRKANL
jgi:hypothetical protein